MNRKRVQRLMRLMGIAALGRGRTSKLAHGHKIYPYLLRTDDRAREPRLGCRHHLYSDRARSLSRWRSSTGHRARCLGGGCRTRWTFRSVQGAWRGAGEVRQMGDFQHRPRLAVHLAAFTGAFAETGIAISMHRPEAAGWTTCSSSGSGGRPSTRTSISRATPMVREAARAIAERVAFYNDRRPHQALADRIANGGLAQGDRRRQGWGLRWSTPPRCPHAHSRNSRRSLLLRIERIERSCFQLRTPRSSDGPDARVQFMGSTALAPGALQAQWPASCSTS